MNSLALAALLLASASPLLAAEKPGLNDVQLAKIVKDLEKTGNEIVPGPALCAALKIGKATDPKYKYHYKGRHYAGPDKVSRTFAYSAGTKDYVLMRKTGTSLQYFHADSDLKIVAGAAYPSRSEPVPMRDADAAEAYAKELAAWAKYADAKP